MKNLADLSVEELECRDRMLTRSLIRVQFASPEHCEILSLLSENRRALKRARRAERTGHAGYVHVHGPNKGQPIYTRRFPKS